MNHLQNISQPNSFQKTLQKNTLNKFLQPQLICIDQQSSNFCSTGFGTNKSQASQKYQRGSRQYIIKSRNQNAVTSSTSQSPQKITTNQTNQQLYLNGEDITQTLKENKSCISSELSVKVSKIINTIISPSSSLSTQSSNKNDQAPTDKEEEDSPLRMGRAIFYQDRITNPLKLYNLVEKKSISPHIGFEQPLKYKQKNSPSLYFQQDNLQKNSISPDIIRKLIQDDKQQQVLQNEAMTQINENTESIIPPSSEKRNTRRQSIVKNISTNNSNNNSITLNLITLTNNIKSFKNNETINDSTQQLSIDIKNKEEIHHNFQDSQQLVQQNIKGKENALQSFHSNTQRRSSLLKQFNNQGIISESQIQAEQETNQQSHLKQFSSTLQQLKLDFTSKNSVLFNKTKKNSSFLSTKRKKLKKTKQIQQDNKEDKQMRKSFIPLQTGSFVNAGNGKLDLKEFDFQSVSDQLENQQLHQKIVDNECAIDDENEYSEDNNEQEYESRKDLIKNFHKENKKSIKTNNSIILPSLVQIGSHNAIEEQSEYVLKAKELEPLNLTAKSVCIFDVEKNKSILSLKGKKSREVASLTKIMTCFIVCQAIAKKKIKQTEIIKVSRVAASMIGTSAFLRSGDQLTVWDLLHGLMLPSGNDAAFALAEYMGRLIFFDNEDYKKQLQQNPNSFENCKARDAIKCFLQEMNRIAKEQKLTSTKYSNPHGLVNKSNRSSAVDICKLSAYCLAKSPLFRQIVKTKLYTCQVRNKQGGIRIASWENTNKCLLRYQSICDGVKTGVTCTAGPCLTTSWCVKDRKFIITILKCDSLEQRYSESHRIFVWLCEKLGIELTEEEKMPYERAKQLHKRNSVESLYSPKESNQNSSLSLKLKPNMTNNPSIENSSINKNSLNLNGI